MSILKIFFLKKINIILMHFKVKNIVTRPDPGIEPIKEPGPGLHGLTWVNSEKLKNIF
jgi:hypothetical protein